MKKLFLPLIVFLSFCFSNNQNHVKPIFSPKKELADTSKIGKSSISGGSFSFEEENGWTFSEEGSASYSKEEAYDGETSLHIVRSNTDTFFTATNKAPFLIEGGNRYRLGFFYKSQKSYGVLLSMNVTTFDGSGNQIRTIEGGNMKLNADSLSSSWSEFFIEFQAKNNAKSAKITIIVKYGNADLFIDKSFCSLTGDDVYDENFLTTKADGSLMNWELEESKIVDETLLIEDKGKALTTWKRFLSGYGYTFTFDAKGENNTKGSLTFDFIDSTGVNIYSLTKEYDLSNELTQKSIEVTVKRGIKAILTFSNNSGYPITIDNVHATKSYSPNDESGWSGMWVTYPDTDVTKDAEYENRWYRKKFTISEPIASASLQVTADDVRYPYLNGHGFGRGGTWSSPNIVDITEYVKEGENIFACRVYNGTYYSGLLFEITIITEGGRIISIYSDKETLSSKNAGPLTGEYLSNENLDWTLLDYDDSSWVNCYVVGQVGCMPWGSIPFISLASTVPEFEVTAVKLPKEVTLGETMSFEITWRPKEKIEKPITISASFWGKYSSDIDEADPAKSVLKQINGPEMISWEVDQDVTIGYEIDIPDFIEKGSYMLQFDEDSISIVNNPDYSNNKLRGHYVKFLETDISLQESKVINEKGFTKVRIGEEDFAPYLFMQSDGLKYFKPVYAQKLYNSGMRLFSVGNNKVVDTITGVSTWTNDNEYNFAPFDETIYTTLSGAPKAKLLVMVSCDPPAWWLNKYPYERALSAKGGTDSVSYASKKWVKDVSNYIRAVLEHMKSMPYAAHIFAVKFAQGITYEWQEYGMELGNCADFSKVAQDGWRIYLKERYKTNAALQTAWGNGAVTFENASIPSYGEREPSSYLSLLDGVKQRNVLDYQDFKAYNVTNSILSFSKVVKEVSNGKWLAGTYQGYITNALTYESSGIANNNFARLLEHDSMCDFFCGPVSYNTRQTGYSNSPMQAATSIVKAGKLCLVEFDERTVKVDMPDQSPLTMDEWGKTYTLEDTINIIKRDAGNTIISGFGSWIYDMTGGWYDDSEIYALTAVLMKEWAYALKYHENENNREVAFIIEDKMPSDYAYNFGGSYSALEVNLGRQKEDLAAIGAGYDMYLASDFKKGLSKDYKFYIFAGNRFEKDVIEGINKECKKDGKAILWIGTPGIYGEDGSMNANNISSLIDMEVALTPSLVNTAVTIDALSIDPLIKDANGLTYGKGEIAEVSPAAHVVDKDAISLGKIKKTDLTGLAYKEIKEEDKDYLSIFSTFGHVPAPVLRNIMRKVGVHIYDDSYSDVVFSSSGYLCIDSPYGGDRTILLPKRYDVYDVYNDKLIGSDVDSFKVTFEAKNTYFYRLMAPNTFGKDIDEDPPIVPPNPPIVDPTIPGSQLDSLLAASIGMISIGGVLMIATAIILIVAVTIKKHK